MEEIPLFYWEESARLSESPLVLQGTGELRLQTELGGCGRGDATDPNKLFLWRTLSSGEIDIGLASLCDARSSKWRRFKPSAALIKNGVIASEAFVGVVTASGDIFRIGRPFSSERSNSASIVSNVQFTPTASCWTRVRNLHVCWVGSDQGEVHCIAFRENGGIEFSTKVELPSKPSSWLRAFARFQKRPVLALVPTESLRGEQNQVCVLFSDGSLLTISLQIAVNR